MRIITCKTCGEEKEHHARGDCQKCYDCRPEVLTRKNVYSSRPEVKARRKEYSKEYYQRPDVKKREKEYREYRKEYMKKYEQRPEVKARRKEYRKEYSKESFRPIICKTCGEEKRHEAFGLCGCCYRKMHRKNPKVKMMMVEYNRLWVYRNKHDVIFRITRILRGRINDAFRSYSKTGKIKPSCEYGIDYKAIIEHLKPFKENHHVDHIIPLAWFDFNNPQEIKWAFAPENHQWLLPEENLWKGNRFIWIKENEISKL